jgi:DNA-directed RNA polymerase subunit RPC12/RpoP
MQGGEMEIYKCPLCNATFRAEGEGTFQCPSCQKEVRVKRPIITDVPWDVESHGNWIHAFWKTLKSSLSDPVAFFDAVARGNQFVRPWVYAILIGVAVFVCMAAYQAGFGILGMGAETIRALKSAVLPQTLVIGPLSIIFAIVIAIVVMPIAITTGLLIQATLFHLGLLLTGAAKRDFLSTFRTVCYSIGPQVFQIIPIFGSMVAGIWVIVLNVIGLKVVHETSYGRSAFAVFLPLILCCGIGILLLTTIAGGIFAALVSK